MTQTPPSPVLVICTDLIFSTRIIATARAAGVPVQAVRTLDALRQALEAGQLRKVIVDLSASGIDVLAAIRLAAAASPPVPVVAFVSHVEADLAAAARAAGAATVLARSAFAARLSDLLA